MYIFRTKILDLFNFGKETYTYMKKYRTPAPLWRNWRSAVEKGVGLNSDQFTQIEVWEPGSGADPGSFFNISHKPNDSVHFFKNILLCTKIKSRHAVIP